jgi:hypothetical protein
MGVTMRRQIHRRGITTAAPERRKARAAIPIALL